MWLDDEDKAIVLMLVAYHTAKLKTIRNGWSRKVRSRKKLVRRGISEVKKMLRRGTSTIPKLFQGVTHVYG